MPPSIRVQLCDDNVHIRLALRRLLEAESDLTVIGEAADADSAIAQLRTLQPDVLLLDLAMPGRSGFEALPDLQAASPATRILVLSLHTGPGYAQHALAAGAHGYLAKDAGEQLPEAIRDLVGRRGRPVRIAV